MPSFRFYYRGEEPNIGRVLRVPDHGSVCEELGKVVDLARFEPHVFSSREDAFVPLPTGGVIDDREEHAQQRRDICLFARSGCGELSDHSATMEALALDCVSEGTVTSSFYGIGIVRSKATANHGTIWRTALQLNAAYTFTIGISYSAKVEGRADVYRTHRAIPCIGYRDEESFAAGSPVGASWIAVEYGGTDLVDFVHPKQAVYLLGAEIEGLPETLIRQCSHHVSISVSAGRPASMNVSAAAAIIMYDRHQKLNAANKDKAKLKATTSNK
jgi:tRNA(Leu) C34 or U34 (ribose-2'-O)-methylase TrmL